MLLDDLKIQVLLVVIRVDQIIIIYYGPQIQRITTMKLFSLSLSLNQAVWYHFYTFKLKMLLAPDKI